MPLSYKLSNVVSLVANRGKSEMLFVGNGFYLVKSSSGLHAAHRHFHGLRSCAAMDFPPMIFPSLVSFSTHTSQSGDVVHAVNAVKLGLVEEALS